MAYLQRLGAEDMDLICEYSRWVLESDQAAGLRVFTGASRPAPPPSQTRLVAVSLALARALSRVCGALMLPSCQPRAGRAPCTRTLRV